METQVIGPDGLPALFENGAWVSSNRSYWWNGVAWVPIRKAGRELPFVKVGLAIVFVAVLGYALYTTFTTESAYTIGYFVGVFAFFAVLFLIYRFVGRWGLFGIVIRVLCAALGLLKILTLIAHPPPA